MIFKNFRLQIQIAVVY